MSGLPSLPDVVVVGAGAAGLAAARVLLDQGRSVLIVEARDRIGGRVFTDRMRLGVPFDMGASWIHGAATNPWTAIAEDLGARTVWDDRRRLVLKDGRPVDAQEMEAFVQARQRAFRALYAATGAGRDVAASTVVPRDGLWGSQAAASIAQWLCGLDLEDVSTAAFHGESSEYDTPEDLLLPEGYGTLVERYGAGLPVRLETRVTAIRHDAAGVTIATDAGTLQAKAVIVTLPTDVLAADSVRFDPALDDSRRMALDAMKLTLLTKIGLRFDGDPFGVTEPTYLHEPSFDEQGAMYVIRPAGADYVLALIGGRLAHRLEAEGEDAQIEAALEPLVRVLGHDVRRRFRVGIATRWGQDPLARGTYSHPRPGLAHLRPELARPHGERILFAGEATDTGGWAGTVAGATISGWRAAREALALLGRG